MYQEGKRDWVFESYAFGNPFTRDDIAKLITDVGRPLPRGQTEGRKEKNAGGEIIIAAVPRREALWQRLNNVLAWAGFVKRRDAALSPHERRDVFHAIVAATVELKRAMRLSRSPGPAEWDLLDREIWEPLMRAYTMDKEEPGALKTVIECLDQLERWADHAKQDAMLSIKPVETKRNKGNTELVALFGGLAGTWLHIWKDAPRRANHPFPLFCRLVLRHIGVELSPRQLRHLLSKVALPSL